MMDILIPMIEALPKVVAAAPEFENLFHELIKGFNERDQEQLKAAYQVARANSDSAQEDFENASRGR